MSAWRFASHRWQKLSITTKFRVAFGVLLTLIGLVAITGIVALGVVYFYIENSIMTSTDIQKLVLEMESKLQQARCLQRDFFLRYPSIGFEKAYQTYAESTYTQIAQVVSLSAKLQQLISKSHVSVALRESNVNLNLFFSAANRYAETFEEAVNLVTRLARENTGLQALLERYALSLQKLLQIIDDPGLMVMSYKMKTFEKEYLTTRKRPKMQSAFNQAFPLRQAIESTPLLDVNQKKQALVSLEGYLATAEKILSIDVDIQSKFNEFDLLTEAIDPIAIQLIGLANQEVESARVQIKRIGIFVVLILIITAMAGLGLASMIAEVLNRSITRNIVKLTDAAKKFRSDWEPTEMVTMREPPLVQIESFDEIGQLAESFNAMATRISDLVSNLEQKVSERASALLTANKQLQHYAVALKDKNTELSQYAYVVAHDLKSPLRAIRNYADFLREDLEETLDDEQKLYLDGLNNGVYEADDLIEDLLELLQIDRQSIAIETIELGRFLRSLITSLNFSDDVKILIKDDWPTLDVEPGLLRQIFQNLITNAVKFNVSPQKRVELGWHLRENNCYEFFVSDNGIGIESRYFTQIFRAFEKLHTKKEFEGTGIGLALVKKAIGKLGGSVRVESNPGDGSTFFVTLPKI